jgi:uncharacterized protein YyaL (SSP411 family)
MNMAQKTIESFQLGLSKFPFALPALVSSFLLLEYGVKEIILVTVPDDVDSATAFANTIDGAYLPNKLLVKLSSDDPASGWLCTQNDIVSQIKNRIQINKPTSSNASICEHFTCSLPIFDVDELKTAMAFKRLSRTQ